MIPISAPSSDARSLSGISTDQSPEVLDDELAAVDGAFVDELDESDFAEESDVDESDVDDESDFDESDEPVSPVEAVAFFDEERLSVL
jgi:hypothetical protein